MRLKTKRLILRQPEITDVDDYLEFINSEFVLKYNAMTPCTREKLIARFSDPEPGVLVLQLKDSGKVIGEIHIQEDSLRYGVASKELSYHLSESYARKGYMKEALSAVIRHLFEKEHGECVSARCFTPNIASLALLRSLGFQQNGTIPRCVKGYQDIIYDDVIHTLFQKDFRG